MKRVLLRSIGLAALGACVLCAQNRLKLDIDAETEEGKVLQAIGTEQDPAKKTALLEDFAQKFPSHNGYPWVLGQLQPAYVKAEQWDKVFPVAEKLLSFDASDAEMAYGGLQAAVGKNDPDAIIKWAKITTDAARKGEKTPKPEDEDEIPMWEYRVKFSQQVQERAEYEVYTAGLRATDPAQRITLMDALLALNPESKFAGQFDEAYFLSYRQMGQNDKALERAKSAAEKGTANEDMLLLLANNSLEQKQLDESAAYSDKLIAYMSTKAAPQGVAPEAWEQKKKTSLGAAYFLKGTVLAQQKKPVDADKVFREGLPFMEGNDQLLGPALFQLGLANYQLGSGAKPNMARLKDALAFNTRAGKIKGPHQGQALKNATVIQQRYRLR